MQYEVKIPHQGFTTEYVTITKWYVDIGDEVEEEMPVFEMESDKATMDVMSSYKGKVVSLLKSVGDEANVGETVLILDD